MNLKIDGREKSLFDGNVYGIKADALDGSIVCLKHHENYLSILKKGTIGILDEKLNVKENVYLESDYILFIEHNEAVIFN